MADSPTPNQALPSGTLTFVFTDIEGSTKLVQELGTSAWSDVLVDHGRIVRGALDAHGGTGVRSEGDSFFYVFVRPTEAVAGVVEAERRLAQHTFPHGAAVKVRIGLHTGEASAGHSDTGVDYVGYDVHRAARIASAGHGGQVLLSETTSALVRDALPPGVSLRDLGQHRFKDLTRAETVYQVVASGLTDAFPRLRTLDAVPNNLPIQLTSFVGRQDDIAEGARLLGTTRLLTLTGPGGTGKTRLSLQIAAQVAADFPGGVTFVPLAAITDPEHVPPAIAQALGLEDGSPRPHMVRLTDHLGARKALLVLDNFEQILAAAPLVAELLKACPELKVVTSSRAPLHVYGEQELPVPPLELPDPKIATTAEAVSQYEAVRLFIERAVAVRPGFQISNETAPAVAEICARLDGLPLAIELAAARIRLLTPPAILSRLQDRLGLLQSGARDLPARQQTLRGAIAWSYDLLEEPARRLFARMAVFGGGASIEDADAVGSEGLGADFLDTLTGLVDHSLLRQEELAGEARVFMLETIREYAAERLAQEPDADEIHRRHICRFVDLAVEAEPHLLRAERKEWLARLEREHDNFRAALEHANAHGEAERAMRLCGKLWRFWQIRGYLQEGRRYTEAALAQPTARDHLRTRELALEGAGGLAYWQGDITGTTVFYKEAMEIARGCNDKARLANALYNLSFTGWASGSSTVDWEYTKTTEAFRSRRSVLEEALGYAREVDDKMIVARVLWGLAMVHHETGDSAGAIRILDESAALFRQLGDLFDLAWALHSKGLAHLRLGQLAEARRDLSEHVRLLAEAKDGPGLSLSLSDFAQLEMLEGDRARGIRLAGASAALRRASGAGLATLADIMEGRLIEPGPEDGEAFAEGLAMRFEDAVAYALDKP